MDAGLSKHWYIKKLNICICTDPLFDQQQDMSCINVTACRVLNNPAPFATPLQFECEFECISPLKDGAGALLLRNH